jgi:hypothetical protein
LKLLFVVSKNKKKLLSQNKIAMRRTEINGGRGIAGAGGRGGNRKGTQNRKSAPTQALLDVVQRRLPMGYNQLEGVSEEFNVVVSVVIILNTFL